MDSHRTRSIFGAILICRNRWH